MKKNIAQYVTEFLKLCNEKFSPNKKLTRLEINEKNELTLVIFSDDTYKSYKFVEYSNLSPNELLDEIINTYYNE
jgi:hypothetical protein